MYFLIVVNAGAALWETNAIGIGSVEGNGKAGLRMTGKYAPIYLSVLGNRVSFICEWTVRTVGPAITWDLIEFTLWPLFKMATTLQAFSKSCFCESKLLRFDPTFIAVFPRDSIDDNKSKLVQLMVPLMRQAINWTNIDIVYQLTYAFSGPNDFTSSWMIWVI